MCTPGPNGTVLSGNLCRKSYSLQEIELARKTASGCLLNILISMCTLNRVMCHRCDRVNACDREAYMLTLRCMERLDLLWPARITGLLWRRRGRLGWVCRAESPELEESCRTQENSSADSHSTPIPHHLPPPNPCQLQGSRLTIQPSAAIFGPLHPHAALCVDHSHLPITLWARPGPAVLTSGLSSELSP